MWPAPSAAANATLWPPELRAAPEGPSPLEGPGISSEAGSSMVMLASFIRAF